MSLAIEGTLKRKMNLTSRNTKGATLAARRHLASAIKENAGDAADLISM